MSSQRFGKARRVRRSAEYQRAFKAGARVHGRIHIKKSKGSIWGKDDPVEVHICSTCVVDGETHVIGPGHSIDVSQGAAHRITNVHNEELVIIEVQRGGYTGEDDICRLEDDYGREDVDATA